MDRYAIIENETIVNVIIADEQFILDNKLDAVKCPANINVGDKYQNGQFIEMLITIDENDELAAE